MSVPGMDSPTATQRVPSSVDVVVVGAGFSGMYLIHRLRRLGMSVVAFEAGDRRRRHMVLEPVSRRAGRRGEPVVLVLVLAGTRAGIRVARPLSHPAGDPPLRAARRRPVRSAPGHRLPDAGGRHDLRRGRLDLDGAHRARGRRHCPLRRHGDRLSVRRRSCRRSPGSICSRARPTTPPTGRTRESTSPVCGSGSSAPARRGCSRSR